MLLAAVVATLAYYAMRGEQRPASDSAASPALVIPPVSSVREPAHYPIALSPTAQTLPNLDESDAIAQDSLEKLFGTRLSSSLINFRGLIRHIVVTVDNLPRQLAHARMRPLKPLAGRFSVLGFGDDCSIDPANALRYAAIVNVGVHIDVKELVDWYIHLYPLFQEAYRELGYPTGYFNDRLIETLDDLLASPDIAEPIKLVQSKVLYEFADPSIEARSAGQKIMVRMGRDNAKRAKLELGELRDEIVHRAPRR